MNEKNSINFNLKFHGEDYNLKDKLDNSDRFQELKNAFSTTVTKLHLKIDLVHFDVETISREGNTKFEIKMHFDVLHSESFTQEIDGSEYLGLFSALFKAATDFLYQIKDTKKQHHKPSLVEIGSSLDDGNLKNQFDTDLEAF